MILTKDVLKMMREANTISFHHCEEETPKGWMVISKDIIIKGYEGETVKKTFSLESEIFNKADDNGYIYAFAMQSLYCHTKEDFSCEYHGRNNQFETILCCLKEGDDIELYWHPCMNNLNLDEARLYRDELILIVKRKGKYMSFTIEDNVFQDNTSRMIRKRYPF